MSNDCVDMSRGASVSEVRLWRPADQHSLDLHANLAQVTVTVTAPQPRDEVQASGPRNALLPRKYEKQISAFVTRNLCPNISYATEMCKYIRCGKREYLP